MFLKRESASRRFCVLSIAAFCAVTLTVTASMITLKTALLATAPMTTTANQSPVTWMCVKQTFPSYFSVWCDWSRAVPVEPPFVCFVLYSSTVCVCIGYLLLIKGVPIVSPWLCAFEPSAVHYCFNCISSLQLNSFIQMMVILCLSLAFLLFLWTNSELTLYSVFIWTVS